jgi:peptidoglycan/LPS O-acetylase OafA/YrhL
MGLRFFASLLVVVFHAEIMKKIFGMSNYTDYSLFNNGDIAVTFFFVLSGFLITYLLLKEKRTGKTVAIKQFYWRRMMRIWPLYYFIVFLFLILIPTIANMLHLPFTSLYRAQDVWGYYVFFLPFMVNILYPSGHSLEHVWSIGVEEVFYIGWAPLFKFVNRYILHILIGIIVAKMALYYWFHYIYYVPKIIKLLYLLQFEAMAAGGLAAYYLFHLQKPLESLRFFSKPAQIVMIGILVLRLVFHRYLIESIPVYKTMFGTPLIATLADLVLFVWFLLNISVNKNTLVTLNGKLWQSLGDMSYGIYMYHTVIVTLVAMLLKPVLDPLSRYWAFAVYYMVTLPIIFLIAYVSKRYMENWFLKRKYPVKQQEELVPQTETSSI